VPPTPAKVFISYSHDSSDHVERVLALAQRLRADGVDAWIDRYENATPEEGWPRWMLNRLDWANFVLLVCTQTYYRRFRGKDEPEKGKGADWEGQLVTLEIYNSKSATMKFVPVIFSDECEDLIPEPLRGASHYLLDPAIDSSAADYARLIAFFQGKAGVAPIPLRLPKKVESREAQPMIFAREAPRKIHNLPFTQNPAFTGRDAELKRLSELLEKRGEVTVTQTVALHGFGGVGKTQLAVEYAWKRFGYYDAVLWVNADSPESLREGLAALASVLGLPETDKNEQPEQIKAVLGWLHGHERWLLIADNADTDAATAAVLKWFSPSLTGHVLITSRISDWPVSIQDMTLDLLSPDDATRYLLDRVAKRKHNAGDEAAARLLAQELGNLPVALVQAASFIIEVRWSFDRYRQQLLDGRRELLSEHRHGGTRYPASIAKTWSISLDQLKPLARALLRIAACWSASGPIPRSVFSADRNVLAEALGEKGSVSDFDIEKALGELAGFSLVDLTSETVSVHRLLQAVEQDSLTNEEQRRWRGSAIRLFDAFMPKAERKHLLNLLLGRTSNYQGRHSLRSELRHLRSMGLLATKQGRTIGDIRDDLRLDLSDYVYLTQNGEKWVRVIE
jgi:hypothetical protein